MYQRGNSFYADWRDAEGQRHRKSFTTPGAATRYEAKHRGKASTHPNQGRGRLSGKSSRPLRDARELGKPSRPGKTTSPRGRSSNTPGTSRRVNLRRQK